MNRKQNFCRNKYSYLILALLILSSDFYSQQSLLKIDDVVELTLINNPDIRIAKNNSLLSYSQYKSTLAQFDPSLNLTTNYSKNKDPLQFGLEVILPEQEIIRYSAGLTKKFDWGLSVSPNLNVTQSDYSLGNTRQSLTQSRFSFQVDVPLLRERGFLGTGAKSEATEILYNASVASTKFSVSEQIKASVSAYLELIAAFEELKIYQDSEKRAEQLIDQTKVLIKADKKPARELDLVEANFAEKKRTRINSEKKLFELRENLLVQLGVDLGSFDIGDMEKYADIIGSEINLSNSDFFVEYALKERDDLIAIKLQTKAQQLLQQSAERNLLNQLNLNFDIGYSGLITSAEFEDLYNGIFPADKGMSYSVGLTYELPINNSLRESELINSKAQFQTNVIRTENLKRVIRAEVLSSLNNLELTKLELDQAENSVELFRKSFENELLKQSKGYSTFFDIDQTEQKLTNALLNKINAKTNYLKAIVNLKHVRGTLISNSKDDTNSVDVLNLFRLNN